MRALATVVILVFVAALGTADEITVEKIVSAHSLGAQAENIIAQINNPANTVPVLSTEDLARLREAGVPDAVVQALLARESAPTQTAPVQAAPTPAIPMEQPDDARLASIVKIVRSGLSESLIAEHIKKSGETYSLSVDDLLYLRNNQVPESVIAALLATTGPVASRVASGAPSGLANRSTPQGEVEVGGLVFKKATFMKKDRKGRLVFKGDEITWVDADDSAESFAVRASGIAKAHMRCQARPQTPFCYEIVFEIFKGSTYKFQDEAIANGVNDKVMEVRQVFKDRYPNVLISERVD
jgi:hypothetical protein